ncbi:MAG: LEA type 2 family protein [Planctomycetota bacterium]
MATRLTILAVAALGALSAGCGPLLEVVGRPRVTAVHPRIAGISLRHVDLAFDVDVKNPYPVPLHAPLFRYGLEIEGRDFLHGEKSVYLDLPARGVGTVSLPTTISYGELWRTYRRLRRAREFSYRLHGVLLVSALGDTVELPVAKAGTVPVMRAPRLRGLEVDYSPVTWAGAGVALRADLYNPNTFPIGLRDLRYRLTLGDVTVGALNATTGGSIEPEQTGVLSLTGRLAAAGALMRLARGEKPGRPTLTLTGHIETPYSAVDLDENPIVWTPFD